MNLEELAKDNKNLVIDFYADWCAPCKMMTPILDSLDSEIKVEKIDIEEFPELAEAHNINSIPTLLAYKDGELKTTITGVVGKEEILECFN